MVDFFSHSPLSNPRHLPQWEIRVRIGFALVTLGTDSITEELHEQGETASVWSKTG